MTVKIRTMDTLPLDGGTLAFHFINTVHSWRPDNLHEYLSSYADILLWCKKVNMFSAPVIRQLENESLPSPARARDAYLEITNVRKLFYAFFSGVAAGRIPPSLLADFNALIPRVLEHYQWEKIKSGYTYQLQIETSDLLLPLYPVVKDAQDVLEETDPTRIKECERCGWIFLDHTKNNQRRWCNPTTCGSVDKLKKYYLHRKNRE